LELVLCDEVFVEVKGANVDFMWRGINFVGISHYKPARRNFEHRCA